MKSRTLAVAAFAALAVLAASSVLLSAPGAARAQSPWDIGKQVAGKAAVGQVEKEVNKRLTAEARKNQCSFKSDTDELAPGCDEKSKRLARALVDAKKKLNEAGVENFKFEISGHTDSSGSAEHNRTLSLKRAEAMKRQLASKGIAESEIVAVGRGSERMLVKPDNTPAKKARNRRYEVQVRL